MTQLAVNVRELGADGLEIANLASRIARLEQLPEAGANQKSKSGDLIRYFYLTWIWDEKRFSMPAVNYAV